MKQFGNTSNLLGASSAMMFYSLAWLMMICCLDLQQLGVEAADDEVINATDNLQVQVQDSAHDNWRGLPANYIDDFDTMVARRTKRDILDFKQYKWHKKRLTWRIMNYPSRHSPISQYQVYLDVEEAFNMWSSMAPIQFQVTTSKNADIRISFLTKSHGDSSPFDGFLGIRAHAFYPSGDSRFDGDIHLDDDEVFTYARSVVNGTNLMYVIAHEIGHSLGLYHSTHEDSIMKPSYEDYVLDDGKLPITDARAIQKLYGKKPGIPDLPPVFTTTAATFTKFDCKSGKYAAAVIRGCLMLYQDERYWRFTTESLYSTLMSDITGNPSRPYFEKLPVNIDAAFTLYNGTTVYIRGRNMWLYNLKERVDAKYPLRVRRFFGVPKNIDAAFHSPRRKITYFFKGKKMWLFNHKKNKGQRMTIRKLFKGLPGDLSAAFEDLQGNRVFLKEDQIYLYPFEDSKLAPGYPKFFPTSIC